MKRLTVLALVATIFASSCALKNKGQGEASALTDVVLANDICADIDDFAKEKAFLIPDMNGLEVFMMKQEEEETQLMDLIGSYYGLIEENKYEEILKQSVEPTTLDESVDVCDLLITATPMEGRLPEPEMINDSKTLSGVLASLCREKNTVTSCKYSRIDSKLCASLGRKKPSWVTDACEITYSGIKTTLNGTAGQFCNFLASEALDGEPDVACGAKIISTVCALHFKAANRVEESLNEYTSDRPIEEKVVEDITGSFASAALHCAASVGVEALKEAILENPEGALADVGEFILGEEAIENLIEGISESGLTQGAKEGVGNVAKFSAKNAMKGVAKGVGFALCRVAADKIADSINAEPPSSYENACGPRSEKERRSRVASCFRTAKSACTVGLGKIDFTEIVGAQEGAARITTNVIGIAGTIGCGIAGKVSSAMCGLISESVLQIKEAVKTGNNSWSDCLGTTKFAACMGEKIGSGGWSNNNGVETAVETDGQKHKSCCWCYRDHYKSAWGFDPLLKRENFVGVIQKGDFKSGNCPRPGGAKQGHVFWDTKEKSPNGKSYWHYHKYSSCGRIDVAGDSCVAGAEIWEDGKSIQKVIKTGSWVPK